MEKIFEAMSCLTIGGSLMKPLCLLEKRTIGGSELARERGSFGN